MAYLIQTTLKPHFWWLYPPFPWYSTDYPYETGSFFLPKIAAELLNKKPWLVEPSMTTTIDSPWLVRKQSFQVVQPFPLKILSYMISYIPRFCWSFMAYIPPKWLVSFEKKHTKSCAPDDYSYVCSEKSLKTGTIYARCWCSISGLKAHQFYLEDRKSPFSGLSHQRASYTLR